MGISVQWVSMKIFLTMTKEKKEQLKSEESRTTVSQMRIDTAEVKEAGRDCAMCTDIYSHMDMRM